MTEPQHMTALALANATRFARSALRRQVYGVRSFEGSCAELAEILAEGVPACMRSMRVEEALRWLYRNQGTRTLNQFIDDTLDIVGCTEFKPVGELTIRQRSMLVSVLRETAEERLAA